MVAQLLRRLGKQRGSVNVCQRWQWKFPGTGSLEGISPVDQGALQVASLARGAADALELVEARFKLLVSDAEVLDGHAVGYEVLPVAFRDVAPESQLFGQHAPVLPVPVHTPATDAVSRQKGPQLPIRVSPVPGRMANRQRFTREVLEQFMADAVCQFVGDARIGEVRIGIAALSPLEGDDVQAGSGEFHTHDGAGPA